MATKPRKQAAKKKATKPPVAKAPIQKSDPIELLRQLHREFVNFLGDGYGTRGKRFVAEKKADCYLKGEPYVADPENEIPVSDVSELPKDS